MIDRVFRATCWFKPAAPQPAVEAYIFKPQQFAPDGGLREHLKIISTLVHPFTHDVGGTLPITVQFCAPDAVSADAALDAALAKITGAYARSAVCPE